MCLLLLAVFDPLSLSPHLSSLPFLLSFFLLSLELWLVQAGLEFTVYTSLALSYSSPPMCWGASPRVCASPVSLLIQFMHASSQPFSLSESGALTPRSQLLIVQLSVARCILIPHLCSLYLFLLCDFYLLWSWLFIYLNFAWMIEIAYFMLLGVWTSRFHLKVFGFLLGTSLYICCSVWTSGSSLTTECNLKQLFF